MNTLSRNRPRRPRLPVAHSLWIALIVLLLALPAWTAAAQTETPPAEEPVVEEPVEEPTQPPAQEPPAEPPIEEPAVEPPASEPTEPPADQASAPTADPSMTPTAEPDQQALELDTSASVRVDYFVCPPGASVETSTQSALYAVCTDRQDGVSFDLRNPDVLLGAQYTGEAGPSMVDFTNVLVGPATLTRVATLPASSAVFCRETILGQESQGHARMSITESAQEQSVALDLASKEGVDCLWFVAEAAPVASTLIVRTAACPLGYDASALNFEEARGTCVNHPGNVTFRVAQAGGGYDGGAKAASIFLPWSTQFNNVPNVPLRIGEETDPGFGEPIAFCGVDDRSGNVIAPVTGYLASGGAFELAAPGDNVVIECDVFNVPLLTGSVTLLVSNCPAGFDVTHYLSDLSSSCQENPGVIDFTVAAGARTETKPTDGAYPGIVEFTGVPAPDLTITGALPPGYGPPVVFCMLERESDGADISPYDEALVVNGNQAQRSFQGGQRTTCAWFNFPGDGNSATVYKWDCPAGTTYGEDQGSYGAACATEHLDVPITLVDANGEHPMTTQANGTQWDDVVLDESGAFRIVESIPAGYGDPVVYCGTLDEDAQTKVTATGGAIMLTPAIEPFDYQCNWYNLPVQDAAVTIHKWTCPEGYDPGAWNADPAGDCTQATNGVGFALGGPNGTGLQATTGDAGEGSVSFNGLEPGSYTVSETVPNGTAHVFVLECIGLNTGSVHPEPLSVGPVLDLSVGSGDAIVCDWYNVPGRDPAFGTVTVSKQICWTPAYVSDVDCETFEGGKAFDLEVWNGGAWASAGSGTTDGAGRLAFTGLEPGAYRVTEVGDTPCRVEASAIDGDGNLVVHAGTETTVTVSNCSVPPAGGVTVPTKFPNTGVGPEQPERRQPAAPILALAGLASVSRTTRRQLLRRSIVAAASAGVGASWLGPALARQDAGLTGTPVPDCLYPATPGAGAPATPVACRRGEVPARIAIAAIDVDAGIEILEIVGGEMQAPSGPEDVAWYKESARLGERGNVLIAGHLNYWGVPEGVFFRLRTLREGDAIEVEGEQGTVCRYVVAWAEDFPANEEPPAEAVGPTDSQSLTLITCGGEWDIDAAEYDHRTVVRAERAATTPTG